MVDVLSYDFEHGALKPAEVTLRREWGGGENNGGMNQFGVQYMYKWKCHNGPCTALILYSQKILLKGRSGRKTGPVQKRVPGEGIEEG
jgi:hypothetical protein